MFVCRNYEKREIIAVTAESKKHKRIQGHKCRIKSTLKRVIENYVQQIELIFFRIPDFNLCTERCYL